MNEWINNSPRLLDEHKSFFELNVYTQILLGILDFWWRDNPDKLSDKLNMIRSENNKI